jgi:arylsulfatase A-like enzyme
MYDTIDDTSVIFLTIDSLRWDILSTKGNRTSAVPCLDTLLDDAFTLSSCFSTGHPTQFALPGLMSSTLPLDYGGYEYGIRDRPLALPEVFSEYGYKTGAFVTGFATGPLYRYDRGFDEFYHLQALGSWTEVLCKQYLRYWDEKLNSPGYPDSSIFKIAIPFIGEYLTYMFEYCEKRQSEANESTAHPQYLSPRLHGPDFASVMDTIEESLAAYRKNPRRFTKSLIEAYPNVGLVNALNSMEKWYEPKIPPSFVQRTQLRASLWYSGLRSYFPSVYHSNGIRTALKKGAIWFGSPLTNTKASSGRYVLENTDAWIKSAESQFFVWAHLFDVHSNNSFSWEFKDINQYKSEVSILLDYLKDIRQDGSNYNSSPKYDLGARYTDLQVKWLIERLQNRMEDPPLIVITADHGQEVLPPRTGGHTVEHFYDDVLHLPVAFIHPSLPSGSFDGLCSDIDIFPTLLDICGFDIPEGIKGVPVADLPDEGREFVFAEDYGRGPINPVAESPRICVRTDDRKLVASPSEPKDDTLKIEAAFDLSADPLERNSIANADTDNRFNDLINQVHSRLNQIQTSDLSLSTDSILTDRYQ